jgi:hypothetical protein
MIRPGEIYMADIPPGQRLRVVVVSREDLNRGKYKYDDKEIGAAIKEVQAVLSKLLGSA